MATKHIKFIDEFPLNPKDILSSFDVFGMSSMEFGMYCKLLFVSWIQKPRQCYLLFDEHNICELCNVTPEEWKKCQAKVLRKFKTEDVAGITFIYNEVLLSKWHEAISNSKTKNGKQLSQLADLLLYKFDEFWEDYDKKVGDKNRLIPKWIKFSDSDREKIRVDIPKRKAAQPDKKFRPNPETYLNGRLWENEIIDYKNEPRTTKQNKTGTYNAEGLSQLNNSITGLPKE